MHICRVDKTLFENLKVQSFKTKQFSNGNFSNRYCVSLSQDIEMYFDDLIVSKQNDHLYENKRYFCLNLDVEQ